jgi:uncharacterized protein YkwD
MDDPRMMLVRRSVLVLVGAAGFVPIVPARAYEGYRAYAEKLISHLPAGAVFRRDLESVLDRLAVEARLSAGKPPLHVDELLRNAARAQAVEMLIGNFVGHTSESGYQYKDRFEAFADPDEHGNHGENAARDRQPGPVDAGKAKRLFQQWLDSYGHRHNLMNPIYTFVASGAVARANHLYAVQEFWER